MKLDNDKVNELKKDFPIFNVKIHGKQLVYLDNAATTQKPGQVIYRITNYYEKENANIHRGVYRLSEEATESYDNAHCLIGRLINCARDEIIFTRSTTESINLLSYTLAHLIDKKRDVIVLTELEHHSNLVPWQQFAKRHNLKLKFILLRDDYTLDYEDAVEKITDKTAILSISHISNALGTINNVKKLVKIGKDKGAITIIDGAQSVPHTTVDVRDIGCDFLAFSGHKMLGPTGIGALYGKKGLLEQLGPFNFGGDMISKVTYQDASWNELPWKFEAGTPNISGGIGFGEAVSYLRKIGLENIQSWEKELLSYALDGLKKINHVQVYNPGISNSAGILSFNLDSIHAHDVASLMDDKAICIRGGHHCAMPLMNKLGITGTSRASFYLYNTFEDIDALIESIKIVQKTFR